MNERNVGRTVKHTFVTGLLLLAPLAITALIVKKIVDFVEATSPFGLWAGLGLSVLLIYLVGWISRTAAGSLLSWVEEVFTKLPGIGTVYGYVRDLAKAFSGDDARFKQPVWVYPVPKSDLRMIGFITRDDLHSLGLKDQVAVFLPLAYNISGTLVILPRKQVKPVESDSDDLLAFVATAGLTGAHEPAQHLGAAKKRPRTKK